MTNTLRRTTAWQAAFGALGCLLLATAVASGQQSESPASGAQALKRLQAGDVEKALTALEAAADRQANWPIEDDYLPAAAGGLFRALAQLDADERYDLLYAWSMPEETRRSVRMLSCLVPQDAPPSAFARALGQRPRDNSFAVAEIGGIRGLFHTGWLLATAADEVGRLRRLIAELEPLAAENVPHAQTLLLLARLADNRGDVTDILKLLEARATALQSAAIDANEKPARIDPVDVVLAAAALGHGPLRPVCEAIFQTLVDQCTGDAAVALRPFLRIAHATAVRRNRGESGPEVLYQNRLKHWVPASGKTSASSARGAVDAVWLVHEDHILHLAGAGNDVLFLRYPLTGDFDFTCETQEGGRIGTDGGLVYGGLQFQALGSTAQLTVWDADAAHHALKPCPFVWHEDRPIFNRVSIRSTLDQAKFAVNLHPVWFDGAESRQSPWLGLRSFADRRPLFRNLKITGNPVIPREVRLSEGSSLRGWQSRFYGQSQPSIFGDKSETTVEDPDWQMVDGVIQAAQRQAATDGNPQSRLHCQRPLLEGELVSYEFHRTSGEAAVHPALGRLAFLLESDGVRIHWMTDGQYEWTGLPQDNSLLEPLNRRGPRPLPLKEDDWNRVTLARSENKVTLSLNDTVIYQRPIDFGGDQAFGFYRDRTQAAARIRNVVMTGDWPKTLPADFLENPAATDAELSTNNGTQAASDITGEAFLAENVREVRRRAAGLSAADRFAYLQEWVLPGPSGSPSHGFRMTGEFTQTQPAPIIGARIEGSSLDLGANLVSPVFDLIEVAKELGKLKELRQRLERIADSADAEEQRAKWALLMLLHLAERNHEDAAKAMDQFYPLVAATTPAELGELWPETLVVQQALHQGAGRLVGDLVGLLFHQRTMRNVPAGVEFWQTHSAAWLGCLQHVALGGTVDTFDEPVALRDWVRVVRTRARSRGKGYALTRWHRNERGEVHHLSGHQESYLFYRSPLRGNFDITCEIGAYGTTQALVAGSFCGPVTDLAMLERGTFRGGGKRQSNDPPFEKFDPWMHYQASFRDGVCTVFFNGRPVYSESLPDHYDPWFGIRSWWRNGGRVRDVRIAGNPQVPEEVLLSASSELIGWLPYHEESAGYEGARWQHVADEQSAGWIIGRRGANLAGTFCESLLSYQRPLVENGSIDYEFFFEPGSIEVHPAMDRLAFLLEPDGVRLHWITDSPFDRTGVSPDNVVDEPHNRRGPAMLPLKPSAWNRLRLTMDGRMLSLALNEQLVYERQLDAGNSRTFGLFHYSSDTEARVRNVVMRAEWPLAVPAVEDQELADPVVAALDADLPRLAAVFNHDFAKRGVDGNFFQFRDSRGGSRQSQRPDGLQVVRPANGTWSSAEIAAPFIVRGDFDLVAEFDQFEGAGDKDAAMLLVARLADEQLHHCRSIRTHHYTQRHLFQTSLSAAQPDGKRTYKTAQLACETKSGRLRLARRGKEVFFLIAGGDSPNYRLCGKEIVSDADTLPGGIDISLVANGTATVSVVWKRLRIAAEELLIPPDPTAKPKNVLFVMNADGSGLKQLTQEMPEHQSHGSPDWSPDGKQIAFDVSGSGGTRVFLVDTDGTALKDLGLGYMPTFSPDGRRLAFTWSGQGMAIMDAEGANRQVVTNEGWGAQWSPDGKWIAYESRQQIDNKSVSNITIIDVKTRQKRLLLEKSHAIRYSQIYWNMEWSPDSRRICFKGTFSVPPTGASSEMAIVDVAGSSQGFQGLTMANVQTDFSWHPDGRTILVSMNSPKHGGNRLFVCDVKTGELTLLPGQPLDQNNVSGVWSPDGSRIVFSSQRVLKPVVWHANNDQ